MELLEDLSSLRAYVSAGRKEGKTISFVPTMGALHDGHMSLVRAGLARDDLCIPYIFVNPKQFAPTEDLANYPRTLESDLEKLRIAGASAVYLPQAKEIYPEDFVTSICPGGVALPLEGEFRPHFFSGVATVVTKMLLQCMPDTALFGEKDYQQLLVIRQVVRDLNIPVDIVGVETARDKDGLALSSRNAYLDDEQYKCAIRLNVVMKSLAAGEIGEAEAQDQLLKAGFRSVDYATVRDAHTLLPPTSQTTERRVLIAAWIGKARLIDNMAA